MNKPKPQVGQIVYSLNVGNAAQRTEQKLTPLTVTKVGRVYFTAVKDGFRIGTEFHIDTWREKTDFCVDQQLYASEQEWLDDKESNDLLKEIRKAFDPWRKPLDLDQLRRIKAIIDESKPTTNR